MTDAAQWLRDKADIENLATLFGRGIDIDSGYFDRCLHDDVQVTFPFGSWRGLVETKRLRDTTISAMCKFTFHHITNPLIEFEGDSGRAEFFGIAAHGFTLEDGGTKIIYGGVIYRMEVERGLAGWRIRKLDAEVPWVDDDGGFMQSIGGGVRATLS